MNLPNWIKKIFKMLKCPHCSMKVRDDGVYGIGLREMKKKESSELSFTFDYKCEKCNNYSTFSGFKTTYEAFISDIMEISTHIETEPQEIVENMDSKPIKKKKSSISDDEIASMKNMLDNCSDYSDFLHKIGINVELDRDNNENK